MPTLRPHNSGSEELVSTHPAELLLLGRISGLELPRPWFDVFLFGRMDRQREIDNLQEELRLRDLIDARRPPFDVELLTKSRSFVELSRVRGDFTALKRALDQRERNAAFGREVA